jgi:hypothetical protein
MFIQMTVAFVSERTFVTEPSASCQGRGEFFARRKRPVAVCSTDRPRSGRGARLLL